MKKTAFRSLLAVAALLGLLGAASYSGSGYSLFGKNPSGTAVELNATATGDLATSPSARTSSATAEILVLNSAATAVPTSALANRRAIEIQNLGPNAIFCRCDGTNPVVNKARKLDSAGGVWSLDCDPTACACKCIAATADQLTTAATIVTETK